MAGEGVLPANAVPGGVCQAGRTVPWLPPCGGSCCKVKKKDTVQYLYNLSHYTSELDITQSC